QPASSKQATRGHSHLDLLDSRNEALTLVVAQDGLRTSSRLAGAGPTSHPDPADESEQLRQLLLRQIPMRRHAAAQSRSLATAADHASNPLIRRRILPGAIPEVPRPRGECATA